ncbi:3-methyl-2-oxobutanoate dehydrogenase (lipoamide) kinase, putative [Eimeria tenella]|uniref:Protein-serine/threonine kinase n=1 Tax=Eimeria tenella TaxID=5802 RepID=U6KRG7_EIMTE|nr:3-methyl-2-oxobutanoate dehydrogenase (lipoamide) kinase, putative [Eimeria tenella]CDJ38033.1 3-methyl-2-oxobutanoate dehydrogenase (lipoamide) kinase, putative [Eimeria tenella]|eukprot:XP_013228871.1 3-methyl-2-oxobutanoate dehydrogenase (lipoamide) kinase, putative [Eimeria tenella]
MARAQEVRDSCKFSYGIAPLVVVAGNLETEFATIPEHLALIITEVLKNALRATVEFYTLGNSLLDSTTKIGLISDDEDLPKVRVEVYKGKKEVVIKVSDKGGGVPPHKLQAMWSFGYSTVAESNSRIFEKSLSLAPNFVRPDMAGYGFGLPLSRAFARYFGGDIHVQTHFGIGTDVYVTLNHIGDQEEALVFRELPDLASNAGKRLFDNK